MSEVLKISEAVKALEDGVELECRSPGYGWMDSVLGAGVINIVVLVQNMIEDNAEYRLKPEQKRIPFTFETFPRPYPLMRSDGNEEEFAVIFIDGRGVIHFDSATLKAYIDYEYAFNHREISFDNGKTWEACGKKC